MNYFVHLAIRSAIYALAALGLNFASGYTGLISVGHGAFLGIGAYTSAILLLRLGVSFPIAFFAAGLVSAAIAFLLSFPLLRLKDDAFVLVSFGFAFIVEEVLTNWQSLTNGALGMKGIPYPAFVDASPHPLFFYFLMTLAVVIVILFLLNRILRSSYGIIIRSIRENFKITQTLGHNAISYQRVVFTVSGFIVGLSGALIASFISAIDPLQFNYHLSVRLLMMVILGGLASLRGSIVGVTLFILLAEALRFVGFPQSILAESREIVYGLLLIVLMLLRPVGLWGKYRL